MDKSIFTYWGESFKRQFIDKVYDIPLNFKELNSTYLMLLKADPSNVKTVQRMVAEDKMSGRDWTNKKENMAKDLKLRRKMEKQTVQEKIDEIIICLDGSEDFNINQVVHEAMEYANRWEPARIEHKYLDYYTYEVTKKVLEGVKNVLTHYAREGKDSYITVKKAVVPDIKQGDIRSIIHDDNLVKMRLSYILYGDRNRYVFANCDQSKFVRPMVIALFEDEVDEKSFKVAENFPDELTLDEILMRASPNVYDMSNN